MKKLLLLFFAAIALMSCERIDAGCEGIKFNLAGSDKGVDDISLVSGWVGYLPWCTQIYEYPTYAQTIDYEAFEVNSKDGTKFTIDPSIILKVENGKSPQIFVKYRKQLDEVIEGSLYIYVKDAARNIFNKFTADSIISNRELVDAAFDERVRATFAKEGFILEQLTPGISYPKSYEDAINAKNKAIQDQMRVSNEIAVAEANAKKAEAEAQKLIAIARAEAEAYRLKTQSLTPLLIQQQWVEKWSGQVPTVVGGNSSMFYDLNSLKK